MFNPSFRGSYGPPVHAAGGHAHRPPSTGSRTPVMKELASSASHRQALAISADVLIRPSGMLARNRARFSGVSGAPMNSVSRLVAPITGQTALTRILSGASSVAMHWVMVFTAPLVPLYQTRPGRGRIPAVLLMLMIE